jgi:hypothetical protein
VTLGSGEGGSVVLMVGYLPAAVVLVVELLA